VTIKLVAGVLVGILANMANLRLLALILERAAHRPPERVWLYMIKWNGIRFCAFLSLYLGLAYGLGWHFGLGIIGGLALSKIFLFQRLFRRPPGES
jgi:hypothetical protein